MKWVVTYRAKDGALREECVEAADRAKCVTECRSRGIAPVKITEGGKGRDKRGPSRDAARGDTRPPSQRRLTGKAAILAAVVLAAVTGGVWWWFGGRGATSLPEERPAKPKMEKPAKPKGRDGARPSQTEKPEEKVRDEARPSQVRGRLDEAQPSQAVTDEVTGVKTNKKFRVVRRDAGKKKLFHNIADIYISRVVNSKPGSLIVGTLNYDRFEEQFRKALEQPITFDEDDTPEDIAKKQAVIDTRAELKKMLDRGEDIAQVMREAEAEGRKLWEYRRSLHMEIAKAIKEGKFKADDMQDYVDAANLMLKDKGLSPLKYPQFWVNNLRQQEMEAAGALGK